MPSFRGGHDPHPLDAWPGENFWPMRRVSQFAAEVEAGEVKLLVQPAAPLGTLADIVDHAGVGQVDLAAAFAVVALQLGGAEHSLGQAPGLRLDHQRR